jgi:hypothetical protein
MAGPDGVTRPQPMLMKGSPHSIARRLPRVISSGSPVFSRLRHGLGRHALHLGNASDDVAYGILLRR